MAYYLSMQRVTFRSADDYAQFSLLFSNVREHLKQLPGSSIFRGGFILTTPRGSMRSVFGPARKQSMRGTTSATTRLPRNGPQRVAPLSKMSLRISRLRAHGCYGYARAAIACRTFSIRPRPRAENARAAVPRLWFSIPGHEGNARLLFAVFKDLEPDLAAPAR